MSLADIDAYSRSGSCSEPGVSTWSAVQMVNQLLDLQDADLVPALSWLQRWFGICQAFSRGPSGVYSTIDPSSDALD